MVDKKYGHHDLFFWAVLAWMDTIGELGAIYFYITTLGIYQIVLFWYDKFQNL